MSSHLTRLLLGLIVASAPLAAQSAADLPVDQTADWAIVSGGRAKPLDTYARELSLQISSKRTAQSDGTTPLEMLWGFHFAPEDYLDRPFIKVNNDDLKLLIGVDKGERRFSFNVLAQSSKLNEIANEGFRKNSAEEPLSAIEKDATRVWNKLGAIGAVRSGAGLSIIPLVGPNGEWTTLPALQNAPEGSPGKELLVHYEAMKHAFHKGDGAAFGSAAASLGQGLRQLAPELYPAQADLNLELTYNRWDTFGIALYFYLLGFLLILAFSRARNRLGYAIGLVAVFAGFAGQTLGIGLRWAIAGRAPVSDMFESLVFMGWGVIAIGLVLELVYRKGYFGMAAGILGWVALIFARNLPMMDSSISPLMPVLRNTSWLSIHVMTIMLSYSAFALAMGIGHIVMFKQLFQPGRTNQLKTLSALLYKTVQIGILFLAAGIAFGAIWANESWGRYWGWDPKETWSAITFFVYLAVVHARYAGWIHHFGLAVCSILSFMAVLFTYYGVNYVLNAGLHSYGRGAGGVIYVAAYLFLELALVSLALWRYQVAIQTGRIAKPVPE